jgi:MtrB/PioB family decaheme-associated outer membrane protein
MRTSRLLGSLALALVPALANAQATAPAPADRTTTGIIDFGVRGTNLSGDAARYERYRDLGDGLFLDGLRLNWEKRDWLLDVAADHVGRKDQRFDGRMTRPGTFKGWLRWDQIPMRMSVTTKTLYGDGEPSVLTIDDAIQSAGQASPASMTALFTEFSRRFDTASRRHIFDGGFQYLARPDLTINANLRYTDREGVLPYGGAFGHSSLVEFAGPVLHATTDFEGSAEFVRDPVILRAGYTGSWFTNEALSVEFDNPFRALDITSASSRGRLSLQPSNSFVTVNGMASVKLPARTRVTGYLSFGTLNDAGDPLISQTINTANAAVITPLDRTEVDGSAQTTTANLVLTSRPKNYVDVNVRYRLYDYDNRTPEFAMTQRVAYDNAPSVATMSSLGAQSIPGPIHSEPFGVARNTFDADVKLSRWAHGTAGVGYSFQSEDRSHRFFEETSENMLRLTFDSVANALFSVRTKYEYSARRGTVAEEAERAQFSIGEQPGMRHYDVAQRNRNRLTVVASVMPPTAISLSFNGSIAVGKDDYIESQFGLRDNTHRVYSLGFDAMPTETATISASYSYERYNALLRSRQANPPSAPGITYETYLSLASLSQGTTVQVADSSRNWASDGTDRVHSFIAGLALTKIREKVDFAVNYDFNGARATYEYITGPVADRTLPEEVILPSSLPTPQALPPTLSRLHRATADLTYWLTERLGLGLSYWYERYRVEDFTLDAQANPNLVRGQVILLGYLYEPYTANTVWGRLFYRW